MRQTTLPLFLAAILATAVATAQTPSGNSTQPSSSSQPQQANQPRAAQGDRAKPPVRSQPKKTAASSQAAATETRPDARYPHPSGQDSQPDNSSRKTHVASANSKTGTGTAENRGAKAADQSRPVNKLSQRKTYTGNSGSKADPGTACSTARPTQEGGVDCGTTGNSATEGKYVTKPH